MWRGDDAARVSASSSSWSSAPLRAALWLAAAACAGAAPTLFFLAGAVDDSSVTRRLVGPVVAYALEWVLLSGAVTLSLRGRGHARSVSSRVAARRAALMVCYSAAVSIMAFGLGSGDSFGGDVAWALFWSTAAVAGAGLAAVAVRRRPDPAHERRALPFLAAAAVVAMVPVDVSGMDDCNEYAGTVPLAAVPYEAVAGAPPAPLVYAMWVTDMACGPRVAS